MLVTINHQGILAKVLALLENRSLMKGKNEMRSITESYNMNKDTAVHVFTSTNLK